MNINEIQIGQIWKLKNFPTRPNIIVNNIDKYHNKLCIDHDAKTNDNIIRGLLCRKCNLTIGFVKHDISILNSMIIYLNKFKDPL